VCCDPSSGFAAQPQRSIALARTLRVELLGEFDGWSLIGLADVTRLQGAESG
jgi:hypothetical protein